MKHKKLKVKFFNTWTHRYYRTCFVAFSVYANREAFAFDVGIAGFLINVVYGPTAEYWKSKSKIEAEEKRAAELLEKSLGDQTWSYTSGAADDREEEEG